ncbi:aconitase iron-sulfur domain-containing protein [Corynespora cassiicola Philippines]|uniref:Aconitase iron-sulfur domain-containing protein n=1 Tax=Corynespora cassiicola Philippines TaxID=1448308 RepID=A0A2T2P732_CORCC|nr:aconitase iron-sulfur domain-containing protein [Corynespora cassiicola Philippines]
MAGTTSIKIALLPGDGPALANRVRSILKVIQDVRRGRAFTVSEHPFGLASLEAGADALPPSTLDACRNSDVVILCALGTSSKYQNLPEQGLLHLRRELGLQANIRKVQFPSSQLLNVSSFRPETINGLDVTFVRDLTGGVYYGARQEATHSRRVASDTTSYDRDAIENIAMHAGSLAMQSNPPLSVYSVDKANVLATSRLWRSTVTEIFAQHYPDVPLSHILVDKAAEIFSSQPSKLNGIILTENLFGDILSDQAGGIIGRPGILASAGLPTQRCRTGSRVRGMFEPLSLKVPTHPCDNLIAMIQAVGQMLRFGLKLDLEAIAVENALRRTLDPPELIGSNVQPVTLGGTATADEFMGAFYAQLRYFLEAANSIDMIPLASKAAQSPCTADSSSRRAMGVVEKIITNSAIGLTKPEVNPGDIVCVKVDWTITSELLWAGMDKTYDSMKRPRLFRNDRVWLAVDHTVDPRTNHLPRQKRLISKAEKFKQEAKIIDFLPANTSIMHTDFTRERAQPGHIVVGSDSHTCSSGSMGALAVGFGAADVVMPMVTGETWFRVPEVCRINFVGSLPYGTSGKDVILHILGLFKRNTIAFQRAVEFGGPGIGELSMDARFAISNMVTEFGGMGSCFEADERTAEWISRRDLPEHKDRGLYFRPDEGARYVEERTIDLSEVRVTVALHPNPDDVHPISEKLGMKLDGCFIGACTTTEEDIILGGLVLEAGLRSGMSHVKSGKRRVTPGSLKIIKRLEAIGILDSYRKCGFEVGAPGCSYCVGINDVDVAGEGEVWLSSQNRNFRNRMGKGSIGNITSAAAVAASSFTMEVTDPKALLDFIDQARFQKLLGRERVPLHIMPRISEPSIEELKLQTPILANTSTANRDENAPSSSRVITSQVQRFGENVDTDAIIPAEFMPGVDNADLGSHCFEYFRPEFREKAKQGANIV